jgi:hypothetical protein
MTLGVHPQTNTLLPMEVNLNEKKSVISSGRRNQDGHQTKNCFISVKNAREFNLKEMESVKLIELKFFFFNIPSNKQPTTFFSSNFIFIVS